MDVVERVHQEVWIYLILQILHLRLDILLLKNGHMSLGFNNLIVYLNHRIGTRHKNTEEYIPIPLQLGERGLATQINIILPIPEIRNLDSSKYRHNKNYQRYDILPISPLEQ